MSKEYWVRKDGKTYGQFTAGKLKRLAVREKIGQDDQVSVDGITWYAASSVKGLFVPACSSTTKEPVAPMGPTQAFPIPVVSKRKVPSKIILTGIGLVVSVLIVMAVLSMQESSDSSTSTATGHVEDQRESDKKDRFLDHSHRDAEAILMPGGEETNSAQGHTGVKRVQNDPESIRPEAQSTLRYWNQLTVHLHGEHLRGSVRGNESARLAAIATAKQIRSMCRSNVDRRAIAFGEQLADFFDYMAVIFSRMKTVPNYTRSGLGQLDAHKLVAMMGQLVRDGPIIASELRDDYGIEFPVTE